MSKNLVIVESPAKARTIEKYLGKDFQVLASYGHVRDLVPKEGAVDPEADFAMKYQLIEKNEKHIEKIAKAITKASALYLATDPDREGEAISWHVYEVLKERGLLEDKERSITPANFPSRSSTRSRLGALWIFSLASICRRCCGRKSAAVCQPAVYRVPL
jgi:reverse gyrase